MAFFGTILARVIAIRTRSGAIPSLRLCLSHFHEEIGSGVCGGK
ncbi:MAG: hypothetical protein ACYDAA_13865 [Syntrophales bacterium]